jgi:hypothetical protein
MGTSLTRSRGMKADRMAGEPNCGLGVILISTCKFRRPEGWLITQCAR